MQREPTEHHWTLIPGIFDSRSDAFEGRLTNTTHFIVTPSIPCPFGYTVITLDPYSKSSFAGLFGDLIVPVDCLGDNSRVTLSFS